MQDTFTILSATQTRLSADPIGHSQREKPGSAQSAPTVPAAGCLRRIGCTPRREESGRPPGRCPAAAAIVARSTRGTGRQPYPRCLAGPQRQDNAAVGLAAAGPIGSPATTHLASSSRWGSSLAGTLVACGWDRSRAAVGTWPAHLAFVACPGFSRSSRWSYGQLLTSPRRRRFASKRLAGPVPGQTASQSMRQPAIICGYPRGACLRATAPSVKRVRDH